MDAIYRLKNLLMREIDEVADRDKLSPELIDGSLKAMCLLNEIQEYENKVMSNDYSMDYSRNNRYSMSPYRDANDYSGARMRSSVTGRYVSSRDDNRSNEMYRDNGYSGHEKEDLLEDLKMRAKYAASDRDRQTIHDAIEVIKKN